MADVPKPDDKAAVGLGCAIVVVALIIISMCSSNNGTTPKNSNVRVGEIGTIVDDGRFGCKEKDEFEKLVSFVSQSDREAFNREYMSATLTGACISFSTGDQVYVTDAAFVGLVKLRKKGETEEYWTTMESVRQ